jgi:hypothetical protein
LGRNSPREEIRDSGLWNINHVAEMTRRFSIESLKPSRIRRLCSRYRLSRLPTRHSSDHLGLCRY